MTSPNPSEHLFESDYGEVFDAMSVFDQTETDYFKACHEFYSTSATSRGEELPNTTMEHINAFEVCIDALKNDVGIVEFTVVTSSLLTLQDQRRAKYLNGLLDTDEFTALKGKVPMSKREKKRLEAAPEEIIVETNNQVAEYCFTVFQNKVLSHTNLFLKICAEN